MQASSPECSELELLAAYCDGRLGAEEAARVERHLSTCSRCFAGFAEALRFRAAEPAWNARLPARPWRLGLAAAVAASLVGVTVFLGPEIWRSRHRWGPQTAEVAVLAEALGSRRVVEPRLTGGFAYGPLKPLSRSAGSVPGADSLEVSAAAGRIEKAARERPTPRTIGALGVAHLVLGDVLKALPLLEEAVAKAPDDARLATDLAAAYLVRGPLGEHPEDLPRALAMADKAIQNDPSLPEARFNQALALERLSLFSQAQQAWNEYLLLDSRSEWASEARQHLESLRKSKSSSTWEEAKPLLLDAADHQDRGLLVPWVRRFPRETREYLEDDLLAAWADAARSGASADPPLQRARLLAEALLEATGDPLDSEVVAGLLPGTAPVSAGRLAALADGYRSFRRGRALYRKDDYEGAARSLSVALEELKRARSPLAFWAELYLVRALHYPKNQREALTRLSALASLAQRREYHAVRGRTLWLRGLIHTDRSELTRSLEDYEQALACFRKTGDTEGTVHINVLMAGSSDSLGDLATGWRRRLVALQLLTPALPARRSMGLFDDSAAAALQQRMPSVAVHFQSALLEVAHGWGHPAALAEAYLRRALIHHEAASEDQGLVDLEAARRWQQEITDRSLARIVDAELSLAEGVLLVRRRPEAAAAALTRVLDSLRATGERGSLPLAYLLRGRASLAQGREDLAESDFEEGIRVFEDRRVRQQGGRARISFFARASELFDEEIRLQVRRHAPERALAFAERQRARELLDSMGAASSSLPAAGGSRPLAPSEIRAQLPEGLALVYYSILPDRLLAWVLTREGTRFAETPVRSGDVERRIDDYRVAISERGPPAEIEEAGARLHEILIAPLAGAFASGTSLVFVPDGALEAVPFAGLWSRGTGRYLVQDHQVSIVPSGSAFISSRLRLARMAASRPSIGALVVGNPRFDGVLFRRLMPLPGAEAEAGEIARLYPDATLLTGPAATKARFLEEASRREVIHYAGHALLAPSAAVPFLLLAGDSASASDGVLIGDELTRQAFGRATVVVLAACGSGLGPAARGEGRLSLGRTLLAAGVPVVVSSLWDVDDLASHRLFVAFHRAFIDTADAPRALRAAQSALLADADPNLRHPAAWAAYESMGASGARPSLQGERE